MSTAIDYFEAITKDKKGCFYADLDSESGSYGVFGSESGFCYSTWSDQGQAEEQAEKANRDR